MKRILVAGAVCVVSLYAIAATAYGLYVRDSAIRGWQAAESGPKREREALIASLTLNAGVKPTDTDKQIVDKITNLLYQRANFGGEYRSTSNDALRYMWTLHGANRDYCSSLTSTLVWALGLFDISARAINIAAASFVQGDGEGDTHTLVEVKAGEQTYLTDPTFNVNYHCGNDSAIIGAKAMNECVRAGKKLTWTYIGEPRKGRRLNDYYLSINKLAVNMDADDNSSEFYTYEYPRPDWLENAWQQYQQKTPGSDRSANR